MLQDFRISVTFTSDWHIGTGAGRQGHIDRLVRRNPADALPYVPAKTLTGILRDSCEALADGLDKADGGSGNAWMTLVHHIFGEQPARAQGASVHAPVPASFAVGPAHMVDPLLARVRANRELASALTFVKPGVRVNPYTGQAQSKHLRMIEVVRGGVALVGEGTLDLGRLPGEWRTPALALLWAGARSVEHIGGQRRRGLGRCVVTLVPTQVTFTEGDFNEFKTVLSNPLDSPETAGAGVSNTSPRLHSALAAQPGAWVRVGLDIYVERPVVVPESVVGNAVYSLDYIPGTYLVGHVLRVLTDRLGRSAFPYLASGEVRVLNACLDVNGLRGRAVPFSYEYVKDNGGLDKEGQVAWNTLCEAGPDEQRKPHRVGYLAPSGPTHLTLDHAFFVETTHATINDAQQRPVESEGGVFTYHALSPGTHLRSEVCLTDALGRELDRRDPNWKQHLNGTARVGVAKKDDYGKVRVAVCEPDLSRARASTPELTVWLLSDVLLRDQSLKPSISVEDLRATLEQELNRGCAPELSIALKVDTKAAVTRVRRSDGWQTTWQLPKPTLVGLQAGSVVRFAIDGTPPPDLVDRVGRIEGAGIGERRGEGFGELVINDPLVAGSISLLPGKPSSSARAAEPASGSPVVSAGSVDPFLTLLELEAWRTEYRSKVATWASSDQARRALFDWTESEPKNSQLGMLRQLGTTFSGRSTLVTTWIEAQRTRKKWTSQSLAAIEALMNDPTVAWNKLGSAIGLPVPAGTIPASTFQRTIWPEAVRILLLVSIRYEIRERERRAAGHGAPELAPAPDEPIEGATL